MLSKFEFSLAVPAEAVRRELCGVMSPTIEGKKEDGIQLPMKIRPVEHA